MSVSIQDDRPNASKPGALASGSAPSSAPNDRTDKDKSDMTWQSCCVATGLSEGAQLSILTRRKELLTGTYIARSSPGCGSVESFEFLVRRVQQAASLGLQ